MWLSLVYGLNSSQDVTLQHYMDYTAESLIPVMAHIAKNVVKLTDGLTKHLLSWNDSSSLQPRDLLLFTHNVCFDNADA